MNFFENILGAPQDFAGNSRSERKEQASCLLSQDFYRRATGAPFLKLCASVPLREVFKKPQIKICDNQRNLRINLFSLVPNEQTEFAS